MDNFTLSLVLEAFTSRVYPLSGELTLYAMRAFGGYDMEKAAYGAVAGAVLAALVWYLAGRGLRHWLQRKDKNIVGEGWAQKNGSTRCAVCFVALGAGLPGVGVLCVIMAGLWRANPWMVLPLFAVSYGFAYQGLLQL